MTPLIHHGTLTIITLALAILGAPFAAKAQPAGKIYRIGWLDHTSLGHNIGTFQEGMRDLGWIPGENFVVEYRGGGGRYERLPELAAELARLPVDVILAPDTAATLAAKRATTSIPVVMVAVGDPVGGGLVNSLARPGGNITGMSDVFPELAGKQLQLLGQVVPRLSRVAVLWEAGDPDGRQIYEQLHAAGRSLGVSFHSWELRHANDIEPAFSAMARERAAALIALGNGTLVNHDRTVDHALRRRLPMISSSRYLALIGGLMFYGPSRPPMFRRAAFYVDKILKGTKPADLPVEQPMTFELVVNLKTAKALGLTIPQSVLLRADRVVE